MGHVREKLEEIRQQQKRLHEHSHASTKHGSANGNSQVMVALGGVAAGLTLALIVWLAKSIATTGHINMTMPERAEVSHTDEFKKSSDAISQLNERVELLTDSVTELEARLMRVMTLTNSIDNTQNIHVPSSKGNISESGETNSASDIDDSDVSRGVQVNTETNKSFVPTHTVKARLNLRPSATLNSKPTAVLKAGTRVEYISQAAGWSYVSTQYNGKGWCSSDYLVPLLQSQQEP